MTHGESVSINKVKALFTAHPAEAGETYFQHLWFTIKMALWLIASGTLLLVHGVFPFTFTHTVSNQITRIFAVMKARAARTAAPAAESFWQI